MRTDDKPRRIIAAARAADLDRLMTGRVRGRIHRMRRVSTGKVKPAFEQIMILSLWR